MRNRRTTYLLLALLLVSLISTFTLVKNIIGRNDDNTRISVSNNKNEIRLEADFPKEKTVRVHQYLRNQLQLRDVDDLRHLEVKKYITSDGSMNFHIKSREGYLKILLRKDRNSTDAFHKIQTTANGLKEVLTR